MLEHADLEAGDGRNVFVIWKERKLGDPGIMLQFNVSTPNACAGNLILNVKAVTDGTRKG